MTLNLDVLDNSERISLELRTLYYEKGFKLIRLNRFEDPLWKAQEGKDDFSMGDHMELIKGRKDDPKEGSYTSYLFDKGLDKILKKVGEEATEVIIAAKAEDRAETIYEIADLMYHVMVLMTEQGIGLDDIRDELASRHVIDHKVKQEKMTK